MSKPSFSRGPQRSLSESTQHLTAAALRQRKKRGFLRVAGSVTALAVTIGLGAVWWTHQDGAVSAPPANPSDVVRTEVPPSQNADDATRNTKPEVVAELLPVSNKKVAPFIRGAEPAPLTATVQSRMDLDEMRKAGRAKLQRELAAHSRTPSAPEPKPAPASVSQPLALAPLPTEPPPAIREAMQPAGVQTDCCPGALPPLPELAKGAQPGNVERRQLVVAAQQVGKGDWQAAHDLYRQLAATTQDELVRVALRRNLEVSEKQLAIQNEPDPARREWLELELARTHQDLGHTFAAQKMWRDLEKRGLHPDVRAQAALLRQDPPAPTRPVTLPAVQPQPEAAK